MQIALRHQHQRAAAGKTRQISHVGETGQHQPIDVRSDQRLTQRGDARGTAVRHSPRPEDALPIHAAPARNHRRRIRK